MKGEPEDTEVYSQRIKKKLQANSRTGQACDRCKVRNPLHLVSHLRLSLCSKITNSLLQSQERKMKCDSGQDGCQPCTSRSLRCMATDRITGHTHERGETARLKSDIDKLRAQINAYYRHFGPLPAEYSLPRPYQAYAPSHGYTRYADLFYRPFWQVLTSGPPVIRLQPSQYPCQSNTKISISRDRTMQTDRIEDQFMKLSSTLLTARST